MDAQFTIIYNQKKYYTNYRKYEEPGLSGSKSGAQS